MTIAFPLNPVDGDTFEAADRLFRYTDPPGVWESIGSSDGGLVTPAQFIDDLGDVDTSTSAPSNADSLVWNSSVSQWIPGTPNVPESDPIFVSSPAYGITSTDINRWNSTTTDLDGGSANSIYLNSQIIDGGIA